MSDIKPVREKTSGKQLLSLAIVNDVDREIKSEFINALQSNDTDVIFWSKRNEPDNIQKLHNVA